MSSSSESAAMHADASVTPITRGRVLRAVSGGAPLAAHTPAAFDRELRSTHPSVSAAVTEAFTKGFDAGILEGIRVADDRTRTDDLASSERARRLVDAIERAGAQVRDEMAGHEHARAGAVLSIAVALAEAVLGHEVRTGTRVACDAVERAMAVAMADPAAATFAHLNPDDVSALGDGDLPAGITVVSDPSLSPGDCVLRVADRSVDARLRTALDRARAVLLDTVHEPEDVRL